MNGRIAAVSIFVGVIAFAAGTYFGREAEKSGESLAEVAERPTLSHATAVERGVYSPNTEKLGKNEMRIISLGTGMPYGRRAQAATSWLVELGNGDKFLFDVGTGSPTLRGHSAFPRIAMTTRDFRRPLGWPENPPNPAPCPALWSLFGH